MSFVSSLDDATSSGAGEEMSFSAAHLADGKAQDESTIRQQLFMKTSEAKRWQDSVLHLSGIATSKDEALSVERSRSAKLALALEDAQEVAAAHKDECEQLHKDRRVAMQQVTMLQSELQTILGTCSGLENQVTQLGALSPLLSPLLHCHASRTVSSARAQVCSHARKPHTCKMVQKICCNKNVRFLQSKERFKSRRLGKRLLWQASAQSSKSSRS
jgi:hypothetical protein